MSAVELRKRVVRAELVDLALSGLIGPRQPFCTCANDAQQGYPIAQQVGRPAGAPRRNEAPRRDTDEPGRRSGPGTPSET